MKHSFSAYNICGLKCSLLLLGALSVITITQAQGDQYLDNINYGTFKAGPYKDKDGNTITVWYHYTEKGRPEGYLERVDSLVEYADGRKMETKTIFLRGDTVLFFQYGYDESGKMVYERYKDYDLYGKMKSDSIVRRQPDGKAIWKSIYDPDSKTYKRYFLKGDKWVPVAGSENQPGENHSLGKTPIREIYGCPPRLQFLAGYSYARAEGGAAGLSMPLGANLAAVYKLSSKVGLALDASYHYRKEDDRKWDRQYIMAGPEFQCVNPYENGCAPFGHVMAGYGRDGYSFMGFKNSGSGFIAALGGGVDLGLNKKTSVRIKADAIPVFFSDNLKIDYRLGIGLNLNSGCKYTYINKWISK